MSGSLRPADPNGRARMFGASGPVVHATSTVAVRVGATMRNKDFTRLYGEHAQPVYAFISYRVRDAALAEDLLADTFERVLRARRGFDRRKGTELTWLYSIALNCVRDNARRKGAETRALARVGASTNGGSTLDDLDELGRRDALRHALAALSVEEQEVLALRFGADLTLADTATVLGQPRTTVEARVYRGLRKLQHTLGPDF